MSSRILFWLGLAALSSFLVSPADAAMSVGDLFEINCPGISQTRLQRMVDEAEDLTYKAMKMVVEADAGDQLAARVMAYMKSTGRSDPQNAVVFERYRAVLEFLQQGTLPPGGKPYLFCDSTWMEWQSWWAVAKDAQGKEYKNALGSIELVAGVPAIQAFRLRYPSLSLSPYWSDTHKAYAMYDYYPPKDGRPSTYCNLEEALGKTETWEHVSSVTTGLRRAITLCPISLTDEPLGSGALKPVSLQETYGLIQLRRYDDPGSIYPILSAEVMTFYHEIFHLVLGYTSSNPSNDVEVFSPAIILQRLSREETIRNAQSYVVTAMAWWYTNRDIENNVQPPIEFFTGYATRGN